MEWTARRPTKEGWYWVRRGQHLTIVRLEVSDDHIRCFVEDGVTWHYEHDRYSGGEWAGPIPEPAPLTGVEDK